MKAITLQGTTDAAGNINIGNLTTVVGRANSISAVVISPNSTKAELYAYGNLLFAYFHAHNDYSSKRDNTNVEMILYYK